MNIRTFLQPFRIHPGFTWITVSVLGICLGACLAVTGIIKETLLRNPDYKEISELIWLRSSMLSQKINPDLVRSIRRQEGFFRNFAAYSGELQLAIETDDDRFSWGAGSLLIGDIFQVLGVETIIGKGFNERNFLEGAEAVMVITYDYWMSGFGGNPEVIGSLYSVNGYLVRLLGVLPEEFVGPSSTEYFDIYIPAVHYLKFSTHWFEDNVNNHTMTGIGRKLPEINLVQLGKRLKVLFANYIHSNPKKLEIQPQIYDLVQDTFHQRKELVKLYSIFGGIFLILFLISLCNSFTFIMLKSNWRRQEILIRQAFGANYRQLFFQFVTEAISLVGLSCAIGLVWAWIFFHGVKQFLSRLLPVPDIRLLDSSIVLITLCMATFLIITLAAVPIFLMRSLRLGNINQGGRTVSRNITLLSIFVAIQVGATVILVIFSFLFVKSAREVTVLDPGYRTEDLLTFSYTCKHLDWPIDQFLSFRKQLEADLESLPGIIDVATGQLNFLDTFGTINLLYEDEVLEDLGYETKLVRKYSVGSGFINIMEFPLVKGRDFNYGDTRNSDKVAIVNQALLDRYFPDEEALGIRFRCYRGDSDLLNVVGVIPNFYISPVIKDYPVVFLASDQDSYLGGRITVRSSESVKNARLAIRRMLGDKYGYLGVDRIDVVKDLLKKNSSKLLSATYLISLAGVMAMLLSLGGLFIIFSYCAVLNKRDYAIRAALGARPAQLLRLTFKRFGFITLSGLIVGVVITWILTPSIQESLAIVHPHDPQAFLLAILVVGLTSLSVALIASLKSIRVDPARELHE